MTATTTQMMMISLLYLLNLMIRMMEGLIVMMTPTRINLPLLVRKKMTLQVVVLQLQTMTTTMINMSTTMIVTSQPMTAPMKTPQIAMTNLIFLQPRLKKIHLLGWL